MPRDSDLRRFEKEIESWRYRVKDANDRKTYDEVFDKQTLLTIYKLFSDGAFDILDFPISTGKEGNVFRGVTDSGDFVAVKIFRLSTATFKELGSYIIGDPRFKRIPRRFPHIIFAWARKEFKNLERFSEVGIRVPAPIAIYRNVLVMEYIGDEVSPARMMKDVRLTEPERVSRYLLESVRKAYCEGGLVHGDMSEYNVLMDGRGDPVIIDLAQGVTLDHWMAQQLLDRDVKNLSRYFRKYGLEIDVVSELESIRRCRS